VINLPITVTVLDLPIHLEDKIFEIQFDASNNISKIVSYFPFSDSERDKILFILNKDSFDGFRSIFTDKITDEDWAKTKDQIKNKFKDELFDIDKVS